MIREDVIQLSDELAELGKSFADGDKETAAEYIDNIFGIIKEGADFVKVPQNERFKAIMHAFALAGAKVADASIKYSDEQ
jgi:hypothetical protein